MLTSVFDGPRRDPHRRRARPAAGAGRGGGARARGRHLRRRPARVARRPAALRRAVSAPGTGPRDRGRGAARWGTGVDLAAGRPRRRHADGVVRRVPPAAAAATRCARASSTSASRGRAASRRSSLAPAANLHVLPDGVSLAEGALLDCVAVAVHAVHRAPVPAGAHVAVSGTGAVGLAAAQVARAVGAGRVTVVGTRPGPLAVARRARGRRDRRPLGRRAPARRRRGRLRDGGRRRAAGARRGHGRPRRHAGDRRRALRPDPLDVAGAMARELTVAFVWSYGYCTRGGTSTRARSTSWRPAACAWSRRSPTASPSTTWPRDSRSPPTGPRAARSRCWWPRGA